MGKEEVTYAIVGIVLGLVLGFLVANWTRAGVSSSGQRATATGSQPTSVNAPRESELPPGHPEIGGAQPGSAEGLPAGHPDIGAVELPSLEPLPASSTEKRTEQQYKNIQVLKGLPAERLEHVMFAFRAALGVDCTHCHIKDQWEKDDKATKQVARKMISMTRDVNNKLGAAGRVTCFTCHRGQLKPAS